MTEIGRLEEVDIREVWPDEAEDFTPWLAEQGGLDILAARLGLKLTSAAREVTEGQLRADVVCYEASDPSRVIKVVIENQLETCDHSHLGQAQTYSLEFEAGICIWVAKDFRPEHLAVLEGLNSTPGREVNFYCVTVKAVRIGDSPPAALFDVILRPDRRIPSNLPTTQFQFRDVQDDSIQGRPIHAPPNLTREFLDELRRRLAGRYRRKPILAPPNKHLRFSLGKGPARFSVVPRQSGQATRVRLFMSDENGLHREWYRQLCAYKDAIDSELGGTVDWTSDPKKSTVDVSPPSSIQESSEIDEEIDWCICMLNRYEKVFVGRLKRLRHGLPIAPRY